MIDLINRQAALPDLRAIELHIRDAFPNKTVRVLSEMSPYFKDRMEIIAYVDNIGVYTTIDNQWISEEDILSILIALIREKLNG